MADWPAAPAAAAADPAETPPRSEPFPATPLTVLVRIRVRLRAYYAVALLACLTWSLFYKGVYLQNKEVRAAFYRVAGGRTRLRVSETLQVRRRLRRRPVWALSAAYTPYLRFLQHSTQVFEALDLPVDVAELQLRWGDLSADAELRYDGACCWRAQR